LLHISAGRKGTGRGEYGQKTGNKGKFGLTWEKRGDWKNREEQTRVEKGRGGMRMWSVKGHRKANRAKVKIGGYINCITRHQRRLASTMQYAGTALSSALVTVNCYK